MPRAVLLGEAAMIELAGGLGYFDGRASLTGPARNPWNPECWTSAASSGSAPWSRRAWRRGLSAAIRVVHHLPTTWCGISGMRPVRRVSRYGAMAIAWSMDKLGPMARTADDRRDSSVIAGTIPGITIRSQPPWPSSITPRRRRRSRCASAAHQRVDAHGAWSESAIDGALKTLEETAPSQRCGSARWSSKTPRN